jgi:hypothetical protein
VRDATHAAELSTWAKEQFSCSFCSRDGGCQEVASCATSGRGAQITGLAQLAPRVFAAPYLNYGTQLCGRTAPRKQDDGGCRSILAKQLRKLHGLIKDALACDLSASGPHAQPLAPPRLLKFYEAGNSFFRCRCRCRCNIRGGVSKKALHSTCFRKPRAVAAALALRR